MLLPCATDDLKPQKGKMNFGEILIKSDLDDGRGSAVIKKDNIFLDDRNVLSNSVVIEYVNQLVAAIQGYREKYENKKPVKGLFVGVQEASFFEDVYCGDTINLRGHVIEDVANIKYIKGIIEKDTKKVAEIVTKIFEIEDPEEFKRLLDSNNYGDLKKEIIQNNQTPPSFLSSNIQRKFYSFIDNMFTGENKISFDFVCPEDFEPFDGHFYGNPVLPGVMLIEIANISLRIFYKREIKINSIKRMKIGGVILPYQKVTCRLEINNKASESTFLAEFTENQREIARFGGSFKIN